MILISLGNCVCRFFLNRSCNVSDTYVCLSFDFSKKIKCLYLRKQKVFFGLYQQNIDAVPSYHAMTLNSDCDLEKLLSISWPLPFYATDIFVCIWKTPNYHEKLNSGHHYLCHSRSNYLDCFVNWIFTFQPGLNHVILIEPKGKN